MKILGIILGVIALFALSVLVVAGMWWVVLWSFNFPIVFAWKQIVGIYAILFLLKVNYEVK